MRNRAAEAISVIVLVVLAAGCTASGGAEERGSSGPSTTEVVVRPDYFQFYASADGTWPVEEPTLEGYRVHLWSTGGFLYLGTAAEAGWTRVTVRVLDHPPGALAPDGDHVAETSIDSNGTLEVRNWDSTPGQVPADAAIDVPRGSLRVRATWTHLAEVDELADESAERLLLELWPAPVADAEVLRWWQPWRDQA